MFQIGHLLICYWFVVYIDCHLCNDRITYLVLHIHYLCICCECNLPSTFYLVVSTSNSSWDHCRLLHEHSKSNCFKRECFNQHLLHQKALSFVCLISFVQNLTVTTTRIRKISKSITQLYITCFHAKRVISTYWNHNIKKLSLSKNVNLHMEL